MGLGRLELPTSRFRYESSARERQPALVGDDTGFDTAGNILQRCDPGRPLAYLVETSYRRTVPLDCLALDIMPASNTPLLPGTLELVVLQLLKAEPTNGYDLSLRIQAVTRDVLNVNAGSLYPALYRLEKRGLVRARWAETESGRRAKVYSVTKAGQQHLVDERESWERFAGALRAILDVT